MVLGFFTGYEDADGLELRVRLTALHYIRTRFVIDFVVVFCDWMVAVVDQLDVRGSRREPPPIRPADRQAAKVLPRLSFHADDRSRESVLRLLGPTSRRQFWDGGRRGPSLLCLLAVYLTETLDFLCMAGDRLSRAK